MKKFKENFYKILINKENFYIKQYYSNFHEEDVFFAVKELKDGIYCVLISDEKNEDIDYSEAAEYIKTLEKTFSLNIIILCNKEYTYSDKSSNINKLILNKENYNVIACDKSCIPLKQIVKYFVQTDETNVEGEKGELLKYKIPTLTLIGMNIIIFLITAFLSGNIFDIDSDVLLKFGAISKILINEGQIWRLLTYAFLHSGIVHIACNMYSLYIIGPQIQQIYGAKKYLFIYFISCITSSLLSYLMGTYNISVGASGGIFGLMGALLAFAIIERHRIDKKNISSLMQIIVINLFIGLSIKNIDNFGHIGGLLGGILVGYIMYRMLNKKHRNNK
ncbi:membrane associated peptidase [Clostridium gelidum]|uniref:Membrane associated peptidase n=1 Tax=Clostridium gelidum TaxID=704125 RepID=A0ABN6J6U6_9CLOT|nr:rhomboid family intramembrane serine protease [Clostridium gelidum]BCZ48662.1 membrane associated peptidase [Clostridium gelidum]